MISLLQREFGVGYICLLGVLQDLDGIEDKHLKFEPVTTGCPGSC